MVLGVIAKHAQS